MSDKPPKPYADIEHATLIALAESTLALPTAHQDHVAAARRRLTTQPVSRAMSRSAQWCTREERDTMRAILRRSLARS